MWTVNLDFRFMLIKYGATFFVKDLFFELSVRPSAVLCMRIFDVAHKSQQSKKSSILMPQSITHDIAVYISKTFVASQ